MDCVSKKADVLDNDSISIQKSLSYKSVKLVPFFLSPTCEMLSFAMQQRESEKNSNSNKYNAKCNYSSALLFNVSVVVYPVRQNKNFIYVLRDKPFRLWNKAKKEAQNPNKKGKLFPCITNAAINQHYDYLL